MSIRRVQKDGTGQQDTAQQKSNVLEAKSKQRLKLGQQTGECNSFCAYIIKQTMWNHDSEKI